MSGFPEGTESAWSAVEQRELADFLRAVRETKAKFLLTSRRDEQGWLGDLPVRIAVPPMAMQERVQLARALAEKHGRRLTDVEDWRPLLRFTQGNPLTITVLVGQALRNGLKTTEQIEAFIEQLRSGEVAFEDEVSEGRSKSLGVSLSYGFEHAFNEDERKQLALLYFFQGFVDVDVLVAMGNPELDWRLPEVGGLTRKAGIALLNRAAEAGLLTPHGDGYYYIHPALPWYFKNLLKTYYPAYSSPQSLIDNNAQLSATHAFVDAMGQFGHFCHSEYIEGNREVIHMVDTQEANLLHARHLARTNSWWHALVETMQGLQPLYEQTGRRTEWKRLVDEIIPHFTNPKTEAALGGLEEEWSIVTHYRVTLAQEAEDWAKA